MLKKIIDTFTQINEWVGRVFSWSIVLLVIIIFIDVLMRYVFDRSFIWLVELETYFFAFSFILLGGYAFKYDKHVRVDIFYADWSAKKKAWVNLLGGLFFLMPWCVISILVCWRYALTSFKLGESSAQAGGLPALYILKFCMVLGFVFLLLQGLATILDSFKTIYQSSESEQTTL